MSFKMDNSKHTYRKRVKSVNIEKKMKTADQCSLPRCLAFFICTLIYCLLVGYRGRILVVVVRGGGLPVTWVAPAWKKNERRVARTFPQPSPASSSSFPKLHALAAPPTSPFLSISHIISPLFLSLSLPGFFHFTGEGISINSLSFPASSEACI